MYLLRLTVVTAECPSDPSKLCVNQEFLPWFCWAVFPGVWDKWLFIQSHTHVGVSSLGLLQTKLVWMFVCRFLGERKVLFHLGKHPAPGVGLLGHMSCTSFCKNQPNCFPGWFCHFAVLPAMKQSVFALPCQHLLLSLFLLLAFPVEMEKLVLKFIWNSKGPRIAKRVLK